MKVVTQAYILHFKRLFPEYSECTHAIITINDYAAEEILSSTLKFILKYLMNISIVVDILLTLTENECGLHQKYLFANY